MGADLGPFGILEEPRPAAGGRRRGEVPGAKHQGEDASIHRQLLGPS